MTQGQQPEAIRLADEYEHAGFVEKHRFAKEEWCRKAALELRRLNTENASLTTGYDAARLEIDSLKERAQELGQMARDCNSRRVIELQAKVRELEGMLAAVGAGGVEPLRKADHLRGATKMVPSDHLRDATEMIEKQPSKLSDSEIDAIAEAMPGGLDGFLKGWGWRQFARAVIGAAGGEDALDAAPQQPVHAVQGDALTREQIRDVFLANGFTIKEGLTDLMPYVYDAAYALLARAQAQQGGA